METDVVCPDCGKLIAPKGAVEESRRCRCGDPPDAREDTDTIPADVVIASQTKTCYICGTDLTGRVRLKDSAGNYWCKKCASADKKKKRHEDRQRCADCGRVFPPEKLTYFQTERVCATCYKAREKKLEKKVKKQVAETLHTKYEKKKLILMAIVGLGLIVAALVFQYLR